MRQEPVRVSIVLPVRNGAAFLPQALDSITANWSGSDELIVVDDGSTDGTAGILDTFQSRHACVRLAAQGVGPAAARNLGLAAARGRWIAFLDHDDWWPQGRLDAHCRELARHRGAAAVMGKTRYVFEAGSDPSRCRFSEEEQAARHLFHLGASTFSRAVFERHGGFDPALRFSEDQDFFLRLRDAGCEILRVPEIGLMYRNHASNMTRHVPTRHLGLCQVLHASILRRRSGTAV
ncbi:putative glycosyltransferase EpsJ [Pigmentiphaga humi]|uniref:Putative glycosyltransferase EpsJ n=1 Tax=Pigmentiphaga humi TaxID=2478468 RepID=A0A3P4B4A7_9BURK|nr:glycosyltransferase family A protein [Pigmentiphaga humi]VCU71119.1 putative glycosyltransferase EpsJ [Pigmentiphaga humi]